MKIKLLLCLALVLGESAFAQQSSEPSRGTNSKNFVIPGFVIAMPSDSETGEEWWMPYTKPLEISRYVDIEDISSLPGIITILRYSSPEEAKRAYQESFIGRPQAPEPLKAVHWDAAHEWTKVGIRGTTDMYLLKGDYLVGLYGLPPFCPAATIDKLLETLAGNIVKAETSGPANGNAVTEVKLKFVRVDSEETNGENGYGKNAVDGDPNTYWHTQWHGNSPGLPHEIVLELVPPSVIHGFAYLPRQDASDHGTIKEYELYASDDGTNFNRLISKGAFGPGKEEQMETFEPIKCRFIKLKAISEINGLPWTSAAEIRVIQRGEAACAKNYWRGNIGPIPSRHNSHEPDAIDSFVAAFMANGGLWLNGIDGPGISAPSPQQVVSETLRTAHFESGMMTTYRILDMRKVRIGEFGDYTTVLADTNLGEMIVLMQNGSMPGHWWLRIYDAHPPYNRLY